MNKETDNLKIHQPTPAKELLELLNDPKRAANLAKLGWDVTEARIECEKSTLIFCEPSVKQQTKENHAK